MSFLVKRDKTIVREKMTVNEALPVINRDELRAIAHGVGKYRGAIMLSDFIELKRAVTYWTVPWMLAVEQGLLVLPNDEITAEEKAMKRPHGTAEMRVQVDKRGFVTVYLPTSRRVEVGSIKDHGYISDSIPVNAVKFEERGWNAESWKSVD